MQAETTTANERLLWSIAETAEALGMSPRTVTRLVDAGKFPRPIRVGKLLRFSREAVETWLRDQQKSGR